MPWVVLVMTGFIFGTNLTVIQSIANYFLNVLRTITITESNDSGIGWIMSKKGIPAFFFCNNYLETTFGSLCTYQVQHLGQGQGSFVKQICMLCVVGDHLPTVYTFT